MKKGPNIQHRVRSRVFWLLLVPFLLIDPTQGAALSEEATADDHFHGGGGQYIGEENEKALEIVSRGLEAFPNDEKLARLKALLDQQQQEQDQQQDQQPNDDQQQDQENQDPQNPQNQDEPNPDQQPPSEEQEPQEPQAFEEMTPEEARMLLDAMREEENARRDKMVLRLGPPVPVDKDW